MYRDASNYKTWKTVVIAGKLTDAQIEPCLSNECEGIEFIPSQVGLEDIQSDLKNYPSADDHVWHTFCHAKPTTAKPTIKLTARQLLKNFQSRKDNWDVVAAVKLHGF